MERRYEKEAAQVAEYIKTLASRPEALDNFECYLSHHFSAWLEKWANTPETMACELREFANMEF